MAYAPGSFTKNFAWHGKGFSKLHQAIRNGFSGELRPVPRGTWRTNSLLNSSDFYIAANFFLFNIVISNRNVIPVDELIVQAIAANHSIAFDRLALFALNLSLGGLRTGSNNGVEFPARWATEFVCEALWQSGRWRQDALAVDAMDVFLSGRIVGVGRTKCRMNYRHLFELARFIPAAYPQINTDAESWIAPALFLAWDRRYMADGTSYSVASDLIADSLEKEHYKLLGVSEAEFHALAAPVAGQYLDAGGLGRFVLDPHPAFVPQASSKIRRFRAPTSPPPADLAWLTVAGTEGVVERQIQRRLAQKRDRIVGAKLKALYDHRCMACETKLLMGLSPDRFYAEAAHIRPLGKPHSGPDTPANMIVLCPNHHLQFDRGVISIRMRTGIPVFVSRIVGDPIHNKPVSLHPMHSLSPAHVSWHRDYFLELPTD